MSDHTKIEWVRGGDGKPGATVNAVNGCSVLSPGCTNCYAMRLAGTRLKHHPSRTGLTIDTKAGPVWNGQVRLSETQLLQPLRWRRPRRIFWNAHGDLFHEAVPDAWIDRVFAVCALTPHHQHLILTKRSARMREYFERPDVDGEIIDTAMDIACDHLGEIAAEKFNGKPPHWPLPNVWLGVSVEDQPRADERIPDLLATPAAVRWISAEPLLGPVDLKWSLYLDRHPLAGGTSLDWIVAGGESGPKARGSTGEVETWMRSIRDQCAAAGVAFFGKQNFRKLPLPDDLMVREFPA